MNERAINQQDDPQRHNAGDEVPPIEQLPIPKQVVSDDGLEINVPNQPPYLPPTVPGGLNQNLPPGAPFLPHHHQAMAMAQYYEARMRDHAAAYASAAAGAAWAAAQIAASPNLPPTLPPPIVYPPPPQYHVQPQFAPPPPYHHPAYAPPSFASSPAPSRQDFANEERPVKRHQRTHPNKVQEKRGRRRQRDFSSSSDTGGRTNQHYKSQRRSHYNKKRREKLSLVGKTGVSALHEWCVYQKKVAPNFVLLPNNNDCFCFAAYVDDLEWSRGRGATKGAAKQDAARKALQALVSGVGFDDNGLVMDVPSEDAVEDLPDLAQRLAIDATKRRRYEVYPGTSTTTEDDAEEDENAYYASRGASVCSALLHAMWQINDSIPEPPSYTFEVAASNSGNAKEGLSNRPSSFACKATLKLKVSETYAIQNEEDAHSRAIPEPTDTKRPDDYVNDESKLSDLLENTLTGLGTGATKREARHVASAQLLSLLFPDCEGMVEVKAAAEAAREKYAESKAIKLQTKRFPSTSKQQSSAMLEHNWVAKLTDPEMPQSVVDLVESLMDCDCRSRVASAGVARVEEDEVSVESLSLSETAAPSAVVVLEHEPEPAKLASFAKGEHEARAHSRQQQMESMVDSALQALNEFDEEGRSLPHEPNFHDVGRTVLRRAQSRDARLIYKLLWGKGKATVDEFSPVHAIVSPTSTSAQRFWGSTSVTLLLCRAIAMHDEPPLGCAVLTLGFSLKKGKVLHVAQIGSEPHLPRERFVELLQQFAAQMKCKLNIEAKPADTIEKIDEPAVMMKTSQLNLVVDSFLERKDFLREESGLKLQAVKEEEPDVEGNIKDSAKPKQPPSAGDKPCKRSRTDEY